MTTNKWPELEEHFESWTGGFPPSSNEEITVYVDYASKFPGKDDEVREYLEDWMSRLTWED
jgi:hypothetical protein